MCGIHATRTDSHSLRSFLRDQKEMKGLRFGVAC